MEGLPAIRDPPLEGVGPAASVRIEQPYVGGFRLLCQRFEVGQKRGYAIRPRTTPRAAGNAVA